TARGRPRCPIYCFFAGHEPYPLGALSCAFPDGASARLPFWGAHAAACSLCASTPKRAGGHSSNLALGIFPLRAGLSGVWLGMGLERASGIFRQVILCASWK